MRIPVPSNVVETTLNAGKGKARYEADKKAIMWRIKKFLGESESLLRCEVTTLDEGFSGWNKPPISLEYNVPQCTASGLKVLSLRVIESKGYKPVKWIRYLTKSGDYSQRL